MTDALFEEVNGTAEDIDSWGDLIWGSKPAFHGVRMAEQDRSFSGRLSRTVLDQFSTHLIEVEARDHSVHRTRRHIERAGDDHCLMIFQLAGSSVFVQDGSHAVLQPGDLVLSSSDRPYSWLHPESFSVYMLVLPQALMDVPPNGLLSLAGRVVERHGPFGSLLIPFVQQLAQEPELLRGEMGHRVAQNLVELVSTRLFTQLSAEVDDRARPHLQMFRRVTDYISAEIGDPELDVAGIARANHVSVRYLQAIFQEQGVTVSAWVRQRRLARIRQDLGDPRFAHRSIGDIAASWGFVDPTSFSRAFRSAFGQSPSACRTQTLTARSAASTGPLLDR